MSRTRRPIIIFAPTLLLANATAAAAQTPGGYWHDGWGYGHMTFGFLMMALFWGGVVVVVVLLLRRLGGGGEVDDRRRTREALQILRERFARGEIDRQEYEERKRVLED